MKTRKIFFIVILISFTAIYSQPFTKKYLMAFHTCGINCSDPRNHTIRMAESNDGINWTLVPNFPTYSGSVPDVIIRGSKLYIYDAGNVTAYDRTTNTWTAKTSYQVKDSQGNMIRTVDPSLYIDEQGRINLFFLNSTGLVGDPAGCSSYPCIKIFDSAIEQPGSDGKVFIIQPEHRVSVNLNSGVASDPDIFFDGTKYFLYISMGQSTAVYSSDALHGSFNSVQSLPGGILTNDGGVAAGYFDPETNKYWSYVTRRLPEGNLVINRASHNGFERQLGLSDFSTIISATIIGLDPWAYTGSPGFCVNDFYNILQPPPLVELISPANSSNQSETTVSFSWKKPAGDIIKYWFEISESSNFTSSKIDSSLTDSTFVNICQLGKQYWWRVRAKNLAGWGQFSEARNFVIGSVPAQVQLLLPSNGLANVPTTIEFKWNSAANASTYQLQISTLQDFSNLFFDDNRITVTSKIVTAFLNFQKYYWRVRAISSIGTGQWSSVFNFITVVSLPTQVTLISPANNSIVNKIDVALKWNISMPEIDRYELEYADNNSFTSSVIESNVPVADKTISVSANKSYWWKVRAHNAAGFGLFSDNWKFTVTLTDIQTEPIPSCTELFQNYPNPFNAGTKISFSIARCTFVKIKIFDALGREIETLTSMEYFPGNYSVAWIPSSIPSGIYFCILSTPDFNQGIKIIYVK